MTQPYKRRFHAENGLQLTLHYFMAFYQFTQTQKIPAELEAVWKFISDPHNLKHITPPSLEFRVISQQVTEHIYAGMIIGYIVKPLLGIPVKWLTEITQVKEKEYFIDEQRMGPYRFWHHQHKIEPIADGVLMTDIVTYAPPFSFLGIMANRLIIRKKLEEIFHFRTNAFAKQFGIYQEP